MNGMVQNGIQWDYQALIIQYECLQRKGRSMNKMSKKGSDGFENDSERELKERGEHMKYFTPSHGHNCRWSGRVTDCDCAEKYEARAKQKIL